MTRPLFRVCTVICTVSLVLLAAASAQAEDWQWPNLNPFSTTPKTLSRRVSDNSTGSWWPSWTKPAPSNGPTTWQKVKAAPGKAMTKTKQTLAPLNPFPGVQKSGGMFGAPKKKSTSWVPAWMTPEEEKGPPLTVPDWMDGDRPE